MARTRIGNQIKTVALIAKKNIGKHLELLQTVHAELEKSGRKVLLGRHCAVALNKGKGAPRSELLSKADLAVVMGGDGTLLNVAHSLPSRKVYVLSINTGTLGFLSESEPKKAVRAIKRALDGYVVLDERTLLRVTTYHEGKKLHTHLALNDAVISQGAKARLIELPVEINQRQVNRYQADGLIIATPTGSTGHSLSAGGPIVHPLIEALIITPICPLSLTNRPIVIPNSRQIKVTVETFRDHHESVMLTIDGQISVPIAYGSEVKIRRSNRNLHLVRMTGGNYYQKLRSKLNWG